MKILAKAALLVMLSTAGAAAQAPELEDVAYLLQTTAAASSHLELARLAAEKATDPAIKRFAQTMVADYTERLERLEALGKPFGVAPLTELDPISQWRLERLKGLEGAAFDATYIAGEEPALDAEEWVHRRTGRHASKAPIGRAARIYAEDTHALYKRALRLTIRHEAELPEGPHPDDASMILFAMDVDLAQLALGKLAVEKAQSQEIKDFAQRMIDEHGQSLDALRKLADERGLTPLTAPGPLEVLVLTQLTTLDGPAFDTAYMQGQVIFHDNWYKRIEYTAHNGKDEAVKAYAMGAHRLGMDHHDAIYAIERGDSPPATSHAAHADAAPAD